MHQGADKKTWQGLLKSCFVALLVLFSAASWAQFTASGNFTDATLDPGWTLSGTSALTAASGTDTAGLGWLRLTGNTGGVQGNALFTGGSFSGAAGLTITFSYVSWTGGSPGADGISFFLYDATQNMSAAQNGGGLGFCKGAGGYLGIGVDEWGNFSNGNDRCTLGTPAGFTTAQPQTLSIRGPTSSNNPFVTNTSAIPGGIDNPIAATRPAENIVRVVLTPSLPVGYTISVAFQNSATLGLQPLLSNVPFPFAPPAALSLGISSSTGGSKNIHEVRLASVVSASSASPGVAKTFVPSTTTVGGTSQLKIQLLNYNTNPVTVTRTFTDALPVGLTVAAAPNLATSCTGTPGADAGGNTVTMAIGAIIPAGGCNITVFVTSSTLGVVTNLIVSGSLTTILTPGGATSSNVVGATATLTILAAIAPRVAKSFLPVTAGIGGTSTLVISLVNPNTVPLTITSTFTDTLSLSTTVFVIATPPNANTTCGGGAVAANGGGKTVTLAVGTVIPAGGCSVTVNVTSTRLGSATNTITANALRAITTPGSPVLTNVAAATATLIVQGVASPTLSKVFIPSLRGVGQTSTLIISLGNSNSLPATLSKRLTDTLPSGLTISAPVTIGGSCPAGGAANAGGTTLTYAIGSTVPVGGCTLSVVVTAANTTGAYTNTLPVGALEISIGGVTASTSDIATAVLVVTPGTVLSISKSNPVSTLVAGSNTTYTIVVNNAGPADASGAVVRDVPSDGLSCLAGPLTCATTPGGTCPGLNIANFLGAGLTIPVLPSATTMTFTLTCGVTATGQ